MKKEKETKKTYRELFELVPRLNAAFAKESENKWQKKLSRIGEIIKPYADQFQKEAEALRLDHASVDKDDNLIYNEDKSYKYSKEALKKLEKDIDNLLDKDIDFKIIPVINPEGLSKFGFLEGWVSGVEFEKEEEIEL